MSSDGFVRREVEGVPFYSCSAFEAIRSVRHGFSTRHGGVSPLPAGSLNLSHVSWDTAERVEENRRRFLAALGLEAASLITLSQIHSDRLHVVEENPVLWNHRTEGDALVTQRLGVALAVQVADCFPVLMADPGTGAIASVHSGWRGALARVVLKTVERMQAAFNCKPARLLAAIGPGIRNCCFEVGPEVVSAFEREFPGTRLAEPRTRSGEKYLLDLPGALAIQFADAGLSSGNIYDLGACTRCNSNEFFSHRRERVRSGRMMGVIARVAD